MTNTKSPPSKQELQRATTSPDEDKDGLLSAALTAAGELIAMARDGVVPDAVMLRAGPDRRWYSYPIDRAKPSFESSLLTMEQYLAGRVARSVCGCDDNSDWETTRMFVLMALCPAFIDSCILIEKHVPEVRAIASRLVITKSMEREELTTHLAPILRRQEKATK